MAQLELRTGLTDGWATVELRGDLDIATVGELDRVLRWWLQDAGTGGVRLDLSGLSFVDSSGLRSMLAASDAAGEAHRRFVVVPGDGQARRLIDLAGVGEHLELAAG